MCNLQNISLSVACLDVTRLESFINFPAIKVKINLTFLFWSFMKIKSAIYKINKNYFKISLYFFLQAQSPYSWFYVSVKFTLMTASQTQTMLDCSLSSFPSSTQLFVGRTSISLFSFHFSVVTLLEFCPLKENQEANQACLNLFFLEKERRVQIPSNKCIPSSLHIFFSVHL